MCEDPFTYKIVKNHHSHKLMEKLQSIFVIPEAAKSLMILVMPEAISLYLRDLQNYGNRYSSKKTAQR